MTTKQIRLNAFAMNCVAHQSPGLWTHPRDRTTDYNKLSYWIDLARTLERGRFDGLFASRAPCYRWAVHEFNSRGAPTRPSRGQYRCRIAFQGSFLAPPLP